MNQRRDDKTSKERRDEKQLDRAVEQTFPASDPVAPKHITGTEAPGSDPARKAPVISPAEVEAATPELAICELCRGSGRVDTVARSEECPQCRGVGKVVVVKHGVDVVRPKPAGSKGETS